MAEMTNQLQFLKLLNCNHRPRDVPANLPIGGSMDTSPLVAKATISTAPMVRQGAENNESSVGGSGRLDTKAQFSRQVLAMDENVYDGAEVGWTADDFLPSGWRQHGQREEDMEPIDPALSMPGGCGTEVKNLPSDGMQLGQVVGVHDHADEGLRLVEVDTRAQTLGVGQPGDRGDHQGLLPNEHAPQLFLSSSQQELQLTDRQEDYFFPTSQQEQQGGQPHQVVEG